MRTVQTSGWDHPPLPSRESWASVRRPFNEGEDMQTCAHCKEQVKEIDARRVETSQGVSYICNHHFLPHPKKHDHTRDRKPLQWWRWSISGYTLRCSLYKSLPWTVAWAVVIRLFLMYGAYCWSNRRYHHHSYGSQYVSAFRAWFFYFLGFSTMLVLFHSFFFVVLFPPHLLFRFSCFKMSATIASISLYKALNSPERVCIV